jgi:SAM-dependent methyltransferase
MFSQFIKNTKHYLPTIIREWLKKLYYFPQVLAARLAFTFSGTKPPHLPYDLIDILIHSFPPVADYDYSIEGRIKRGTERAKVILDSLGGVVPHNVLELGCMDAMTSAALLRHGVSSAIGLDINNTISPEASEAGVKFLNSPAENIPLVDSSLDLVFSFNTMEHFANPVLVLQEVQRVLRPGGYFFTDFDPLYYSARGLHAYKKINIPYCQFLFKNEDLIEYAERHQLNWAKLPYVNKYSADQFRNLWSNMKMSFKIIYYKERVDLTSIGLICKYPFCFKKNNVPFHNFFISHMRILAKKNY